MEQPNGHQLNKGVKEVESIGMLNADLVDDNNRDDKSNWQLDNLYRKNKMLQIITQGEVEGKRLRFREENGAFDSQAYDLAMKAETHDMITASGYRLIITTNAQMDAGAAATHFLSGLSLSSTREDVAAALSAVLHPKVTDRDRPRPPEIRCARRARATTEGCPRPRLTRPDHPPAGPAPATGPAKVRVECGGGPRPAGGRAAVRDTVPAHRRRHAPPLERLAAHAGRGARDATPGEEARGRRKRPRA